MPTIWLVFLSTIGILSPTNLDSFFITKIKFEFGSIINGFDSEYFTRLDPFLFIMSKRLILPINLLSFDTMYPSVVFSFVNILTAVLVGVEVFNLV